MDKTSTCFKGIYQHFYEENFSEENFTTHYIAMAYEFVFTSDMALLPFAQYHDYRWFKERDLLNHNEVYMHIKWYLQSNRQTDNLITAKGKQISVREFATLSAKEAGIELEFTGIGLKEITTVKSITGDNANAVKVGDVIVRVDSRYFRPAEAETLLGDPTKPKEKLGWVPQITVEEMCAEMMQNDLSKAKQHALL
jgi:GDP-D-mannose dehydratase